MLKILAVTVSIKVKNIIKNIKNLINWLPIIWNDKDWDYSYFLKIVEHKLKSMKKFYANEAWSIEAPKTVDEIDECLALIDKLLRDDYDYIFAEHKEKWGDIKYELKDEEIIVKSPKILTEEDEKRESNEHCALFEFQYREEQRDISNLFIKIADRLKEWWD
jgi:hypothetical protein